MFILGAVFAYVATVWLATMSSLDSGLAVVGLTGPCAYGYCSNIISYHPQTDGIFDDVSAGEHLLPYFPSTAGLLSVTDLPASTVPRPADPLPQHLPYTTTLRPTTPETPFPLVDPPQIHIPDFTPVVCPTVGYINPPPVPRTMFQSIGMTPKMPTLKYHSGPKKASRDRLVGHYIILLVNFLMLPGIWPTFVGVVICVVLIHFESNFMRLDPRQLDSPLYILKSLLSFLRSFFSSVHASKARMNPLSRFDAIISGTQMHIEQLDVTEIDSGKITFIPNHSEEELVAQRHASVLQVQLEKLQDRFKSLKLGLAGAKNKSNALVLVLKQTLSSEEKVRRAQDQKIEQLEDDVHAARVESTHYQVRLNLAEDLNNAMTHNKTKAVSAKRAAEMELSLAKSAAEKDAALALSSQQALASVLHMTQDNLAESKRLLEVAQDDANGATKSLGEAESSNSTLEKKLMLATSSQQVLANMLQATSDKLEVSEAHQIQTAEFLRAARKAYRDLIEIHSHCQKRHDDAVTGLGQRMHLLSVENNLRSEQNDDLRDQLANAGQLGTENDDLRERLANAEQNNLHMIMLYAEASSALEKEKAFALAKEKRNNIKLVLRSKRASKVEKKSTRKVLQVATRSIRRNVMATGADVAPRDASLSIEKALSAPPLPVEAPGPAPASPPTAEGPPFTASSSVEDPSPTPAMSLEDLPPLPSSPVEDLPPLPLSPVEDLPPLPVEDIAPRSSSPVEDAPDVATAPLPASSIEEPSPIPPLLTENLPPLPPSPVEAEPDVSTPPLSAPESDAPETEAKKESEKPNIFEGKTFDFDTPTRRYPTQNNASMPPDTAETGASIAPNVIYIESTAQDSVTRPLFSGNAGVQTQQEGPITPYPLAEEVTTSSLLPEIETSEADAEDDGISEYDPSDALINFDSLHAGQGPNRMAGQPTSEQDSVAPQVLITPSSPVVSEEEDSAMNDADSVVGDSNADMADVDPERLDTAHPDAMDESSVYNGSDNGDAEDRMSVYAPSEGDNADAMSECEPDSSEQLPVDMDVRGEGPVVEESEDDSEMPEAQPNQPELSPLDLALLGESLPEGSSSMPTAPPTIPAAVSQSQHARFRVVFEERYGEGSAQAAIDAHNIEHQAHQASYDTLEGDEHAFEDDLDQDRRFDHFGDDDAASSRPGQGHQAPYDPFEGDDASSGLSEGFDPEGLAKLEEQLGRDRAFEAQYATPEDPGVGPSSASTSQVEASQTATHSRQDTADANDVVSTSALTAQAMNAMFGNMAFPEMPPDNASDSGSGIGEEMANMPEEVFQPLPGLSATETEQSLETDSRFDPRVLGRDSNQGFAGDYVQKPELISARPRRTPRPRRANGITQADQVSTSSGIAQADQVFTFTPPVNAPFPPPANVEAPSATSQPVNVDVTAQPVGSVFRLSDADAPPQFDERWRTELPHSLLADMPNVVDIIARAIASAPGPALGPALGPAPPAASAASAASAPAPATPTSSSPTYNPRTRYTPPNPIESPSSPLYKPPGLTRPWEGQEGQPAPAPIMGRRPPVTQRSPLSNPPLQASDEPVSDEDEEPKPKGTSKGKERAHDW